MNGGKAASKGERAIWPMITSVSPGHRYSGEGYRTRPIASRAPDVVIAILPRLQRNTPALRAFPLLCTIGCLLILFVTLMFGLVLASDAVNYFGGYAKVARDGAPVGSTLLGQLAVLSTWPKLLVIIATLGFASLMTGIVLAFAAMAAILDKRAFLLSHVLPLMGRARGR